MALGAFCLSSFHDICGANTGRQLAEPDENVLKISAALEVIANRKSTAITSIALAYVIHKTPYVFPSLAGAALSISKAILKR
jgi:aryl-alcohol dehydrogenase-like predicted oxidoreductase